MNERKDHHTKKHKEARTWSDLMNELKKEDEALTAKQTQDGRKLYPCLLLPQPDAEAVAPVAVVVAALRPPRVRHSVGADARVEGEIVAVEADVHHGVPRLRGKSASAAVLGVVGSSEGRLSVARQQRSIIWLTSHHQSPVLTSTAPGRRYLRLMSSSGRRFHLRSRDRIFTNK